MRAPDLDPHHVTALRGGHHDRRVAARRAARRLAGGVDPRHVRDQMGERLRHAFRVDLGLDRRRVHRELRASRADQLGRPLDARRHHRIE